MLSALIAGGGAPEIEVALRLRRHAQTLSGKLAYCVLAFADALEVCNDALLDRGMKKTHARHETTHARHETSMRGLGGPRHEKRRMRGLLLDCGV